MATQRRAEAAVDDEAPPWERYDWWLSPEETRAWFERDAQALLGISGDGFLRRYDAGEYDEIFDDPDHRHVLRMYFWGLMIRGESGRHSRGIPCAIAANPRLRLSRRLRRQDVRPR